MKTWIERTGKSGAEALAIEKDITLKHKRLAFKKFWHRIDVRQAVERAFGAE